MRILQLFILIFGVVTFCAANADIKIYEFTRNASLSIPGKRLTGHIIEEFSTKKQVIHCAYECLKSTRCRSFNYEHVNHVCQINDADHVDYVDSLVDEVNGTRSEYNHRDAFSIDQEALGPCALDPCENGGRCLDTVNYKMERTYFCICTDEWMGSNCDMQKNRIDWDEWENWGPCSVSCETGWTTRRRRCMDTVTGDTLSASKCYGRDVEYDACTLQSCPKWLAWSDWGICSTKDTCGRGVMHRYRNCSNGGVPGRDRYCLGFTNETAPCKGIDCQGMMIIRDSVKHGDGLVEIQNDLDYTSMAICADDNWGKPEVDIICKQIGFEGAFKDAASYAYNVSILPPDTPAYRILCTGSEKTIQACKREPVTDCASLAGMKCRIRGGWALWSGWGECSVTCENGTRTRTRDCNHPPPNYGGTPCPGDDTQFKPCTLPMCPRNGTWGEWETWTGCDVTCGEGERMRVRKCIDMINPCYGTDTTYDICLSPISCPVDGVWVTWSSWSECDVTCENGTRFRTRICTGPFYGGAECPGPDNDVEACFPRMCPIDGVWNDWVEWTHCSHTCGYGNRNRSRVCDGPYYGGAQCSGSPDDVETCNAFSCPVDGSWLPWATWRDCSVTCNGGLRNRTRVCNEPEHGGETCPGPSEEAEPCNEHECPIDGVFAEWSLWSECSVTCANGTKWRERECFGPYFGGANCTGPLTEEEICVTANCPVDGVWDPWQPWQTCNVTCGGGRKLRQRTCAGPYFGGNDCEGPEDEWADCSTNECPVDGEWDIWASWETCNKTCGGGFQKRTRNCISPQHGGAECLGEAEDWQDCNTHSCAVDGEWETWQSWSSCNASCGGGVATRTRICHAPLHGGANCTGENIDLMPCSMHDCPVDGVWEMWSNWTQCTHTCGPDGTQVRNRTCTGPFFGGTNCSGDWDELRACNSDPCPIDGVYEEWSSWSECSMTCGRGTTYRNRTCFGPYFGGTPCEGAESEIENCYPSNCPVPGLWNTWTTWSDCSTTCENGTRTRDRTCDGPYFGGADCEGLPSATEDCFLRWCPVDGNWTEWTDWDECPVTCGGSIQNRTRECIGPFHGGTNCTGSEFDSQDCNTLQCPVDGQWSLWSRWGQCNVTCGGGTSGRTRYCSEGLHGGSNCTGTSEQFKDCNTHECPINGVWDSWGTWAGCSLSCGTGERQRFRNCTGPFFGGAECEGPLNDTEHCNTHNCPVDGVWDTWMEWGTCNVSCGGGTRERTRGCTGPFYGGSMCPGKNMSMEECNKHECPIDGVWTDWSVWDTCSVTCGGGNQSRYRNCTGPFYDGANCTGAFNETQGCSTHNCPIDGYPSEWSNFYECDVTCDGGIQWRNRSCIGPFYGGADCSEPMMDSQNCSTQHCPIDGVYSSWSAWESCDVTCDGGIQWRDRVCEGPYYGGADCEGPATNNQTCNDFNCPVDGVWDPWSDWDTCPVTCGGGKHSRYRVCIGPFYEGANCTGSTDDTEDCNSQNCPEDGVFLEWSSWYSCDLSCGGGIQLRNRSCHGPFYGGANCSGAFNESQSCNTEECPIDGVWFDWQIWGGCTTTCGGGQRVRLRECDGPYFGGAPCPDSNEDREDCATDPCPIPGLWGPWAEWSMCTVTCGGGVHFRNRTCNTTAFGDLTTDCDGDFDELADCHTYDCLPLAIHCADWASRGLNQTCIADVDPDGEGVEFGQVQVECDFDTEPGRAVTIIHHDQENTTQVQGYEGAGEYEVTLNYYTGWGEAIKIVDSSDECAQFIRWDCLAAIIHNPFEPDSLTTYWMNRTEQVASYFGGATPGSGNCACGETGSCFNASLPCNCDVNDEVWRFDEGFITNKAELPILSFHAGDTAGNNEGGVQTLGPLLCSGNA